METFTMHSDPNVAKRQHWMGVLARAAQQLQPYADALKDAQYSHIRHPEIGMTLVRGRIGGTGEAFNLGEMSVTRCVVRLEDGRVGFSYVSGRDKQHAELAALADAHLQGSQQQHWLRELIEPLAAQQQAGKAAQAAETATTQVEFFTLVRGED
jgi:alpha-D-ribose 1-methylphosphonate 5-triphosphate synthase subunit PhnG